MPFPHLVPGMMVADGGRRRGGVDGWREKEKKEEEKKTRKREPKGNEKGNTKKKSAQTSNPKGVKISYTFHMRINITECDVLAANRLRTREGPTRDQKNKEKKSQR